MIEPYDHRWRDVEHYPKFRDGTADNRWWLGFWRARAVNCQNCGSSMECVEDTEKLGYPCFFLCCPKCGQRMGDPQIAKLEMM